MQFFSKQPRTVVEYRDEPLLEVRPNKFEYRLPDRRSVTRFDMYCGNYYITTHAIFISRGGVFVGNLLSEVCDHFGISGHPFVNGIVRPGVFLIAPVGYSGAMIYKYGSIWEQEGRNIYDRTISPEEAKRLFKRTLPASILELPALSEEKIDLEQWWLEDED
ncbi:hypothetical protein [Amorphus orientalis]|uniref:Uncharacterized protein n=1 Tax=Amorphus orientalis TaxID=649198 RepID=A0AAE3VMK2_9HYPH|nr:hypothetical protein [Amorphus orientalis]MDQ0314884.1 hypothetical protein [Amorphus orientalis]